jgi:cyclohexa-1,5-dienecarbonyl-CoA hydratase
MTRDPAVDRPGGAGSGIVFEAREDVAYVTLNAPPLNILTAALMDELSGVLEQVLGDRSLKALCLTATGKAFSAGASVDEHRPEQSEAMIGSFGRLFRRLDALEVPCVVGVTGSALGGGFELAMMADVLVASEEAVFGQPEIRLGFFAPVGVLRLPALVGPAKAIEITCSGRNYTAAEMQACGLVARVVPAAQLEEAIEAVLKDFRRASPLVMRMNVRTLKQHCGRPFEPALAEAERTFLEELMRTEDVREGLASFFEKRRPVWKNR